MENVPTAGWAAVVYGRTAAADTYWQAVPAGVTQTGWLARVVYAVFDKGRELEEHPRFLLAQESRRRLVGVACAARELSGELHSDGLRELFCFVGWLTVLPADAAHDTAADDDDRATDADKVCPNGPELDELADSYVRWAGPIYADMMTSRWHEPMSAARRATTTQPGPAPWYESEDGAASLVPCPDTGLWPAETWPLLWSAAMATPDPLTCVVGWQRAGTARRNGVTHLGAANAARRAAPVAPPRKPRPAPEPEPLVPGSASLKLARADTADTADTEFETLPVVAAAAPVSFRARLLVPFTWPRRRVGLPAWPGLPAWCQFPGRRRKRPRDRQRRY